jgi:oligopeptide transport system substrate-binding protein
MTHSLHPLLRSLFVLTSLVAFTFCNSDGRRMIKGDIEAGNAFRLNESSAFRSLHPLDITEGVGSRMAAQVYEGLVKFDQNTLEIKPALAENWEPNEDGSVWTFYLREGVRFHDDACFPEGQGREVTAEDVIWCMRELCTSSANNQMYWLLTDRVLGASKCYNTPASEKGEASLPEGIVKIDDHTVQFSLIYPMADFPKLLGHSGFYIYPREATAHYGEEFKNHPVGTGPFSVAVLNIGTDAILVKNTSYWGRDAHGNKLPYLDSLFISFNSDKKEELKRFRMGELDMVFSLPVDMYADVMSGLDWEKGKIQSFETQVKSSLGVHYLSFNHADSIFKDRRVRKAFNLAIDRSTLVDQTLRGDGEPAVFGIVPSAFKNFEYKRITPIKFNLEEAQNLMSLAGFPQGEGFPEITLHVSTGSNNEAIARAAIDQLKLNLGVDIRMETASLESVLSRAEAGELSLWSDGWIADYPNPENFLRLFVSNDTASPYESNYLNNVGYSSELYDSIYFSAIREKEDVDRMDQYRILSQLLIDEAVVLPLYYDEFTRLVSARVRNFPQNSIEFRDFSTVWIDSSAPEQ